MGLKSPLQNSLQVFESYIQTQFKFITSSVQFELRLALSLIITTHPPGKVEVQLESGHIWSVGSWWIVCLVIFGGGG